MTRSKLAHLERFFFRQIEYFSIGALTSLVLTFSSHAGIYNMGAFWKGPVPASYNWPFDAGTDASYTFDSTKIDLTGGVCRLTGSDQVDSDNTATGFASGTHTSTTWDSTGNYLRLSPTNTSTLHSSWTPQYANIVGYWKLDGTGSIGSGAPANNITQTVGVAGSSSNANNSGMTYATGKVGEGITFDGVDDYVNMGDNVSITSNQITIACWFKPNALPTTEVGIVAKESNYKIDYQYNGNVRFLTSNNWAGSILSVSNPLTLGAWHHVVATYDGATKKLYFNGVASATTISTTGNLTSTTKTLRLGNFEGGTEYLNGALDDCAIWNTALTATQVQTLYERQSAALTNTSEFDSSWTPKWANILGVWHLNEPVGSTTFADSSGNGRNGTRSGSIVAGASARLNKGAQRTSAGGLIQLPLMATTGNMSFSGWVYWTQSSASGARFFYNGNSASNGYGLKIESAAGCSAGNKLGIYMAPSTCNAVTGAYTFPTNQWVHVVMTRTTNTWKIYVNGVLVDTGTATPVTPTGFTNIYYATFEGTVDEVALWDTDLTADDVAIIYNRQSALYSGTFVSRVMDAFTTGMSWTTLSWVPTLPFFKELTDYAAGALQNETSANYSALVGSTGATGDNDLMSGLKGLWHFNEAAGTSGAGSVTDDSGQGKHGTPTNITFGGIGRLGGMASYNGTSSSISLPTIDLSTTDKVTVSLWYYSASTPAASRTLFESSTNYNSFTDSLIVYHSTNRKISCSLKGNAGYSLWTAATIPNGEWTHIACIYDTSLSTNEVKVYINGVLSGANGGLDTNNSNNFSNRAIYIGTRAGTTDWTTGGIDEVALWSRVLNTSEIQQLYRRGANRIKYQVRVCTASDCSDDSTGANWKGPDGTNQTYFSELNNNSVPLGMTGDVQKTLPTLLFSNFTSPVGTSRYFQYRTILETDDTSTNCNYGSGATWCSPELKSVTVDPVHYSSSSPSIIGNNGFNFRTLSNFTETVGASCSSGIGYNLSLDKVTWYWWDSAANAGAGGWVAADGTATKSNAASVVATNVAAFRTQVGSGTTYVKAYLKSTGTTTCELSDILINGTQ